MPRRLKLNLQTVRGRALGEQTDVVLEHQTTHTKKLVRRIATRSMAIEGLLEGAHSIHVDPPSYMGVTRVVQVPADGTAELTMMFPVDPDKVTDVRFPEFVNTSADCQRVCDASSSVLGFQDTPGAHLFAALSSVWKACLLNVICKLSDTTFESGRRAAEFVRNIVEIRQDRVFAFVDPALRLETRDNLQGGLSTGTSQFHHDPPQRYEHFTFVDSRKSKERYGNLQITLFRHGPEWIADIDIDDAGGFEHFFQVIGHQLHNEKTHPYLIHQILLGVQQLDPGYEPLVEVSA